MTLDDALRETVRGEVRAALVDLVLPAVAATSAAADLRPMLKPGEVQKVLRIGWSTLDDFIAAGELDAIDVGGQRRITRESLDAYLERHRVPGGRTRLRAVAP